LRGSATRTNTGFRGCAAVVIPWRQDGNNTAGNKKKYNILLKIIFFIYGNMDIKFLLEHFNIAAISSRIFSKLLADS
jgi:hypothetical protein